MHKSLVAFFNSAMYGSIFFVLFIIDFLQGNGFVDMFLRLFCKMTCFVKKTIREEAKVQITGLEQHMNLPVLFAEIFVLSLTVIILNKYKQFKGTDRIDELLQESKDALRETNEFLEKWRLRRINWQQPTEYSYLDEEPQEIKPLKLEIPILHMAIIDTLGISRNQSERGDAGDAFNITDSTLLSVLDEEMGYPETVTLYPETVTQHPETDTQHPETVTQYPEPVTESSTEKIHSYNSRDLWDVAEEDDYNLHEM